MPPIEQQPWPIALGVVVTRPGLGPVTTGPRLSTRRCGVSTPAAGTAVASRLSGEIPAGPGPVMGWDAWTARRLTVAMAAYEAGFFLVHTIEIGPDAGGIPSGQWARLWVLAMRTEAEAVFVLGLGPVEREVLEPMTAELRIRLYPVDPSDETDTPRSAAQGARG